MVVAGQPLTNTPFAFNAVKGLHAVPGHPFVGAFLSVATLAGGDYVGGAVFATFGFRANVVDSQVSKAGVNNWSAAAICAAVVPGIFD